MKFTLSTKPFSDALNLGIIQSNVSKYFRTSCLAQLTADRHELRVNLQASNIFTELYLKGSGDSDEVKTAFVDCLVLRSIVATFDAATTTIEYTDNGLILHSGSSKCTLPYLADAEDGELTRPEKPAEDAAKVPINMDSWKFIKSHQMYAAALSFVYPVYMNAWVGESGDVIVGDYNNSRFTFSKKSNLGRTCLLTDTIINLFNSLPEGAEIVLADKSYIVTVKTDSFSYLTQFTPKYEGDEGVGDYNADLISATVVKNPDDCFQVPVEPISKFISQSAILSTSGDTCVELELEGNELHIKDSNIDCKIKVEGTCSPFKVPLNSELFKPVISHLDEEVVNIGKVIDDEDGTVSGLVLWTKELTVVLGAMEAE